MKSRTATDRMDVLCVRHACSAVRRAFQLQEHEAINVLVREAHKGRHGAQSRQHIPGSEARAVILTQCFPVFISELLDCVGNGCIWQDLAGPVAGEGWG